MLQIVAVAHFSQLRIRSIIYALWNQAPAAANSFLELLNTCHAGKWERNSLGFQLTSTSGAGYSQSFHIPLSTADPSNISDANLQDTFYSIIEAYQVVSATGLDEGVAGNPDFIAAMLAEFPTVKGYVNNFTYQTT